MIDQHPVLLHLFLLGKLLPDTSELINQIIQSKLVEFPLILVAGCPTLHGSQHLGELEVVNNLLLCHLHYLSLPLQHCEVIIHPVLLQLALKLRALLLILKQVDHLLRDYHAVADQLFELCRLAPAQLQLG